MSYKIAQDHRKILDTILPYFEFNEVLNINNCIRRSMDNDLMVLKNVPINLYTEVIRDFLIKYSFANNFCGDALIKAKGMALKNAGSLLEFEKTLKKPHDFVLIDDDNLNNIICKKIILKVIPDADIKSFTDPNIGLRHIYATCNSTAVNDTILLLDINMPTLMGWGVLDEITAFPDAIKNRLKIYMLTSSVDPRDKSRAGNNPILWGFIEKPLTDVKVTSVLLEEE